MNGRGSSDLIGRDHERAAVGELLDAAPQRSASLLISGAAGIGKTTLWRWGIEEAARRGMTVLSARAAGSEAEASFTTLTDLLDPFLEDLLPSLPTPQAEALEVALLRRSSRVPIGDRVVGAALLSAFRELGLRGPTIVALDDVQWVDVASAAALSFAIRRLDAEPVGVLATERPIAPVEGEPLRPDGEGTGTLVQALSAGERLRRVELDGLSIAALHSVLAHSFGHGIARPLLLRIHRATNGNPLFALELARAIGDLDVRPHEPLPVPADLQQLVLGRIRGLSPEVRDVLLVAAASPAPSTTVVELAGGENVGDSLDAAQASGIIWIAGDSIAFEHPLFASAVYASAAPHRRRSVHARLARVLPDPEERARHLALATAEPDEGVAAMLEEVGATAKARGARAAAAELFEMAAKLTPQDSAGSLLAWGRRITAAATCHHEAGSGGEANRLLHGAIDRLPAGPVRAEALWTLVCT
jgi:predicted ATPase